MAQKQDKASKQERKAREREEEMERARRVEEFEERAREQAKHRTLRAVLMAALEAPNEQIASGLIEGLSKAGWRLEDRFELDPSGRMGGSSGSTAAELAARFYPTARHEQGAWAVKALGALGADWNEKVSQGLSPMEIAAQDGNAPALSAMAETGGDWLGRRNGKAPAPANSPMSWLWSRELKDWSQGYGSDASDLQRLRDQSFEALERAAAQGKLDASEWASQLGASLLNALGRSGQAQWGKAWDGFVKRCAKLGWSLEAPLRHPEKSGPSMLNALGVGTVERPTLALALAASAGDGGGENFAKALRLGLVKVDPRSQWALALGAIGHHGEHRSVGAQQLRDGLKALAPWAEQIAGATQKPEMVAGSAKRWDGGRVEELRAELDVGLGSALAWLCSPTGGEAKPAKAPKLGAGEAKALEAAMECLDLLALAPGSAGWEGFKASWSEGFAKISQGAWLGGDEDDRGWIVEAAPSQKALGSLKALSGMGERGMELASCAMRAWAGGVRAEIERGGKAAPAAPEMAWWAQSAEAAGLWRFAEDEGLAAMDACVGSSRSGTRQERDALAKFKAQLEAQSLKNQTPAPAPKDRRAGL